MTLVVDDAERLCRESDQAYRKRSRALGTVLYAPTAAASATATPAACTAKAAPASAAAGTAPTAPAPQSQAAWDNAAAAAALLADEPTGDLRELAYLKKEADALGGDLRVVFVTHEQDVSRRLRTLFRGRRCVEGVYVDDGDISDEAATQWVVDRLSTPPSAEQLEFARELWRLQCAGRAASYRLAPAAHQKRSGSSPAALHSYL